MGNLVKHQKVSQYYENDFIYFTLTDDSNFSYQNIEKTRSKLLYDCEQARAKSFCTAFRLLRFPQYEIIQFVRSRDKICPKKGPNPIKP